MTMLNATIRDRAHPIPTQLTAEEVIERLATHGYVTFICDEMAVSDTNPTEMTRKDDSC